MLADLALIVAIRRDFELLCWWFLQNDPEFRAEYKQVWLWRDWPGRWVQIEASTWWRSRSRIARTQSRRSTMGQSTR
jgi:hypothetical protein